MSLNEAFSSSYANRFAGFERDEVQDLDPPFKLVGTDEEKLDLIELVNRVSSSETGKKILEEASALGYTLRIDDLGETTMGVCRSESKELVMSSHQNPDKWVSTLVHEARHAGQISRGAIAGYTPFVSMQTQMPEKRLMEADAVACSIQVCQELFFENDYMPLSLIRKHSPIMVDAYELAQDGRQFMTEKEKSEVLTTCLLGWYDNELRKMAYELNHVMDPLSMGYAYLNSEGTFKEISLADSVKKICTMGDSNYFSEPVSVLEEPYRAGLSEPAKKWVDEHVKVCQEMGADVDPSLEKMPVYKGTPFIKNQLEEKYGKMPEALTEKGKKNLNDCLKENGRAFSKPPKLVNSNKENWLSSLGGRFSGR